MDAWGELGRSVLGSLVYISASTTASDHIELADRKLVARNQVLGLFREGVLPGQIDMDEIDPPPVGVSPGAFLERAHREVANQIAMLHRAGHLLALYARSRPGLQDSPRWRAWLEHHEDTLVRARLALRWLRYAMAHVVASRNAFDLAISSFPRPSAEWDAWMAAAEQLTHLARDDAFLAWGLDREMLRAVRSEISDVISMVIRGDG
ncbi:hypothetical protein ACP70R_030512 [Stipagrostis hirtigluma subsp. patula]